VTDEIINNDKHHPNYNTKEKNRRCDENNNVSLSGTFKGLERVTFSNKSDTYYTVQGIDTPHSPRTAPQVVLHCSSPLSSTLYVRLIRRCLQAAISVTEGSSIDHINKNDSILLNSDILNDDSSSSSFQWVPGGGSAEMGWSALWGMIGHKLSQILEKEISIALLNNYKHKTEDDERNIDNEKYAKKAEINKIRNGFNNDHSNKNSNKSQSYRGSIEPLVVQLSNEIVLTIRRKYSNNHKSDIQIDECFKPNALYIKAVHHTVELCQLISTAYEEIPKQLLANSLSLKVGEKSRKHDSIWKLWKDNYGGNLYKCDGNYDIYGSSDGVYDTSSGNDGYNDRSNETNSPDKAIPFRGSSAGRVGLIYTHGQDEDSVCGLFDAMPSTGRPIGIALLL
jgi:flagellar biosynthesis regulator FlaF